MPLPTPRPRTEPLDAPPRDPGAAADERWQRLAVAAALAIVVGYGAVVSFMRPVWLDESYAFNTATRSLAGTLRQTRYFELQPPLYFVLLNGWLRVHASVTFGRLMSTLFAAGTVWTMHRMSRELALRTRPIPLVLVAALSPTVLWAATEMRCYSLLMFMLSLSMLFLARGWLGADPPVRRTFAGYVLASTLACLTSYYAAFALAGAGLGALLATPRRRSLLAAFGVTAILLLPALPGVLHHAASSAGLVPASEQPVVAGAPLAAAWQAAVGTLTQFWQAALGAPVAQRGLVLAGLTAAAAVALLVRRRPGSAPWSGAEWVALPALLVPFLALLTVRDLGVSVVYTHHWSVVVPGAIVLVALVLQRAPPSPVRATLAAVALIALLLGDVSMTRNLPDWDWPGVARALAAEARPGEPVFVIPSRDLVPLEQFYRGANPLIGVPSAYPLDAYDARSQVLTGVDVVQRRIDAFVRPGGTYWMVRELSVERLGTEYADSIVARADSLGRHHFPGTLLDHLRAR
jgi:hypothetical protein